MEKVLYAIYPGDRPAELGSGFVDRLAAAGAHRVQVNLDDAHVATATDIRYCVSDPAPAGMISVWVDSANQALRQPVDDVVAAAVPGPWSAYLVAESVPLRNTAHPSLPGERTVGYAQIAFLHRRTELTPAEFWRIWKDDHTQLAIDTQDTFGYVQNLVVQVLTDAGVPYDAIVEELFPESALTDRMAAFAAAGDPGRFREHTAKMMQSCARFLDQRSIDVIATSRYCYYDSGQ